jgi:two-component system sensor histidine kinase BaeS
VLQIVDDGPGMSAAGLGRLLERGLRGNQARTRAPDGRGLGLDIVHRVVRLHGWELTLQPRAPRGLEVVIAGPLAPA